MLPVINHTYEVYKELIDIITHLEKRWKYGLGSGIENDILDLISLLIMAKNAPKPMKGAYLIKASSIQEIVLLKLRLFLELKLCNETRVFQIQAKVTKIGGEIGGWLKSVQSS